MPKIPLEEAYSFDDVLVLPNYSDVLPDEVNTTTQLTQNITLKKIQFTAHVNPLRSKFASLR